MGKIRLVAAMLLGWLGVLSGGGTVLAAAHPAPSATAPAPIKIIVDTDLGDDIDDSFALAWALATPRFEVVAVTSAWGDTTLRDRMIRRILVTMRRDRIPIGHGVRRRTRRPSPSDAGPRGHCSPARRRRTPSR